MDSFLSNAGGLLDGARAGGRRGEDCCIAILIGHDGAIRAVSQTDWPLDSLARRHGARTAYLVTRRDGRVRVEGREGSRRCVLEHEAAPAASRSLLPHGFSFSRISFT